VTATWLARTVALLAVLLVACASGPQRRASGTVGSDSDGRLKLAVLPVESDAYPQVALMLNQSLREARMTGVDDYFVSQVTLDVVQLSIECVDSTSACYSAVGKSLMANRLLMGHITAAKKRRSVRVIITVFDVDNAAAINVVDKIFESVDEAAAGVAALVADATGQPPPAKVSRSL
jgi:hypothetical protein